VSTVEIGVGVDTPCDEWDGPRDRDGYGRLSRGRRAHRVAWEEANGPIPDGMCVLHRCDNPPCRRLDHLFLGTVADNNRDKALKGRAWRAGDEHYNLAKTHCKHGHPLEGDNLVTYTNRAGTHRGCKECGRRTSLASYHRRQAANRRAFTQGATQ